MCVWQRCEGGHVWQRGACSVKGAMHDEGAYITKGACMAGGHVWWGICLAGGTCVARKVCMVGACMAGEMATAADGTHPTGIHSC